jgi:hypothetical protein
VIYKFAAVGVRVSERNKQDSRSTQQGKTSSWHTSRERENDGEVERSGAEYHGSQYDARTMTTQH